MNKTLVWTFSIILAICAKTTLFFQMGLFVSSHKCKMKLYSVGPTGRAAVLLWIRRMICRTTYLNGRGQKGVTYGKTGMYGESVSYCRGNVHKLWWQQHPPVQDLSWPILSYAHGNINAWGLCMASCTLILGSLLLEVNPFYCVYRLEIKTLSCTSRTLQTARDLRLSTWKRCLMQTKNYNKICETKQ
jgi:hypothetical protein